MMPRGGDAARPSPRVACSLEPRPRQALGVLAPYATVRHHDRNPLSPGLAQVMRYGAHLTSHGGRCRPGSDRQHSRRLGGADVFLPPIRHGLQHGDVLPPQRRLAGELVPLLLPGGIGVQREDQLAHVPCPRPAPALHAEDGHHARDPCSEQRQRIKGPLAHPQRPGTGLPREGVEVALDARQMIVAFSFWYLLSSAYRPPVEVHHASVRRGMRKDHAAAAPIAGCVRPGARRHIAHAQLLRQRQGNAALLQVGCAAAARQGGLERGKLWREVWPRWGRLTWDRWACRWRAEDLR